MRRSVLLLLFGIVSVVMLLVSGCNEVPSALENIPIVSDISDLGMVGSYTTVSLDDTIPVSYVKKIAICDSLLLVLTPEGLNCYGLDGEFRYQISQAGRAANEWLGLSTFFLSNDGTTICLVDGVSDKLLWYDIWGNFHSSCCAKPGELMNVNDAAEMPDGRIVFSKNIFNSDRCVLSFYTKDMKDCRDLLEAKFSSYNTSMPTGKHPFSLFNGNLLTVLPFSTEVLQFDGTEMTSCFKIPLSGRKLQDRKISQIRDYSIFKSFEMKNQGFFVGYTSIYETESYYILTYYNMEYLIVDKTSGVPVLFKPELGPLSENVQSFYDIVFTDDRRIVSFDSMRYDGKVSLIIFSLVTRAS